MQHCLHLENKTMGPNNVWCHLVSWISHKYLQRYTKLIMKVEYIEKVSDMEFQAFF